jgi:antitoxin component HigA of HigAB toxin-antitoxin module
VSLVETEKREEIGVIRGWPAIDRRRQRSSNRPKRPNQTARVVSEVLSGKRDLSKAHIAKLSARFHVSPALFF